MAKKVISLTGLERFKSKLPQYIEDLGFIKNTVNNLANYYLKSETYTKSETDSLIAAIKQFTYIVEATLPTASASTMYKIYLIPASGTASQNIKDEYITINTGTDASPVYVWEKIGSTAVDLSDYSTTDEMNAAIAAAVAPFKNENQIKAIIEAYGYETSTHAAATYVEKVSGKGLSSNDYTNTEKEKLAGIAVGAQVNVLEGVEIDDEQLSITNKKVTIPTATNAEIDALFS